MKDNVTLQQEKVEYKKLNGRRSKYNIYEVNVQFPGQAEAKVQVSKDLTDGPFEEKYRPRIFSDLVIDDDIISQFKEWKERDSLPHILLYSQAGGTGKTSISQVLVNETKADFLCISANIDRGIAAVKDKIVPFSQNVSMFGDRKIVSVEEIGDSTTAQIDSLKSVIDMYSNNTSMILTTNSLGNISQPLRTRFKIIDFNKIPDEKVQALNKKLLYRICAILDIEGIEYSFQDIGFLMKKFKFSFREIMLALDTSVVNNKLEIAKVDEASADMNEILQAINSKDLIHIASISEKVNHIQFIESLNINYLTIITKADNIPAFIMATNTFQISLNSNVPFPGISFVVYCNELMNNNVEFRLS